MGATALDRPQEQQQTGDQGARHNTALSQFLGAEVYAKQKTALENVSMAPVLNGKDRFTYDLEQKGASGGSNSAADASKVAMLSDFRIDNATEKDRSADLAGMMSQREFDVDRATEGGYQANPNARKFTGSDNGDRLVA